LKTAGCSVYSWKILSLWLIRNAEDQGMYEYIPGFLIILIVAACNHSERSGAKWVIREIPAFKLSVFIQAMALIKKQER
jgi:hypothetical protein